ncbi:MAG TPA: sigma-70 family RNA polymerase sigma factor [Pseudonocardia sp.]|nr:sigma-70 family RNA polymerase sigma factor [Pseudonocardia sp.]
MHAIRPTDDVAPRPAPQVRVPEPVVVPPERELDEVTLVVRAQEGDVRAFELLARRHQGVLFRVAVRIVGDPADAEDALQEALLDAWRRIAGFQGDSAFSTWMYRIVTNRCLDLLRRRRPVVPVDEIGEDRLVASGLAAPGSRGPEHAAEVDAGMAALRVALARLPDEQRVCWVLRELEGLGYTEIAQITGATGTAVRGRIHRARKELAEVMRSWR